MYYLEIKQIRYKEYSRYVVGRTYNEKQEAEQMFNEMKNKYHYETNINTYYVVELFDDEGLVSSFPTILERVESIEKWYFE